MPAHNEDIAAIFEEMADLLEIENANPFRVRAYRNAARTVRGMGRELAEMVADGEDLTQLPGIGKDLSAKIVEIVSTGHAKALDRLHREVPAGLEDMLRLPGLGPRRVRTLYDRLHIKSIKQLADAARRGRLRELPGFGEKTEQNILEAIAAQRSSEKRFMHRVAQRYAGPLVDYLRAVEGVDEVVVAGSYRRGRETVGDLDILATADAGGRVTRRFTEYEDVVDVVSRGSTRSTVYLRNGLQVDLRVVDSRCFGAALQYFTGSKAHSIAIRRLGQKRGLKINEYGVFRGDRSIAGHTEASVYEALDLPWIPPELRENRGEIEAARRHRLPTLIETSDLQGDLHVHSKATDGSASLREMARAAKARGLKYIAITDHSRHLTVAHGLDVRRLEQQIDEIDELNDSLRGITLLKGIEADILEDGHLDMPEQVLARLDMVIGAVHSRFRLSRRKQTERILRAMDAKYFTLLAHPSGRLIGEREAYDVDMERIIRAAKERGCYLEINSQPQRLDLNDSWCLFAKQEGVRLVINSDAHSVNDFDLLEEGVRQARRGWLEKGDVINTRGLQEIRKLLRATRA